MNRQMGYANINIRRQTCSMRRWALEDKQAFKQESRRVARPRAGFF